MPETINFAGYDEEFMSDTERGLQDAMDVIESLREEMGEDSGDLELAREKLAQELGGELGKPSHVEEYQAIVSKDGQLLESYNLTTGEEASIFDKDGNKIKVTDIQDAEERKKAAESAIELRDRRSTTYVDPENNRLGTLRAVKDIKELPDGSFKITYTIECYEGPGKEEPEYEESSGGGSSSESYPADGYAPSIKPPKPDRDWLDKLFDSGMPVETGVVNVEPNSNNGPILMWGEQSLGDLFLPEVTVITSEGTSEQSWQAVVDQVMNLPPEQSLVIPGPEVAGQPHDAWEMTRTADGELTATFHELATPTVETPAAEYAWEVPERSIAAPEMTTEVAADPSSIFSTISSREALGPVIDLTEIVAQELQLPTMALDSSPGLESAMVFTPEITSTHSVMPTAKPDAPTSPAILEGQPNVSDILPNYQSPEQLTLVATIPQSPVVTSEVNPSRNETARPEYVTFVEQVSVDSVEPPLTDPTAPDHPQIGPTTAPEHKISTPDNVQSVQLVEPSVPTERFEKETGQPTPHVTKNNLTSGIAIDIRMPHPESNIDTAEQTDAIGSEETVNEPVQVTSQQISTQPITTVTETVVKPKQAASETTTVINEAVRSEVVLDASVDNQVEQPSVGVSTESRPVISAERTTVIQEVAPFRPPVPARFDRPRVNAEKPIALRRSRRVTTTLERTSQWQPEQRQRRRRTVETTPRFQRGRSSQVVADDRTQVRTRRVPRQPQIPVPTRYLKVK